MEPTRGPEEAAKSTKRDENEPAISPFLATVITWTSAAARYAKIAVCEELGDRFAPAFERRDLKAKDVQTALVGEIIDLTYAGSSIALALSGWSSDHRSPLRQRRE